MKNTLMNDHPFVTLIVSLMIQCVSVLLRHFYGPLPLLLAMGFRAFFFISLFVFHGIIFAINIFRIFIVWKVGFLRYFITVEPRMLSYSSIHSLLPLCDVPLYNLFAKATQVIEHKIFSGNIIWCVVSHGI